MSLVDDALNVDSLTVVGSSLGRRVTFNENLGLFSRLLIQLEEEQMKIVACILEAANQTQVLLGEELLQSEGELVSNIVTLQFCVHLDCLPHKFLWPPLNP